MSRTSICIINREKTVCVCKIMNAVVFLVLMMCAVASAFRPAYSRSAVVSRLSQPLRMADDADSEPAPRTVKMTEGDISASEDPDLFEMNRIVRLGRSRDQDGKSNIWSIEPMMEVEDDEEGSGTKKNLVIAGAVIGTAIACLPLFAAFSRIRSFAL